MKNIKENSIKQIERAILERKNEVIDSLKSSRVEVADGISDNDLLDLIMTELKKGNGYLIYHLSNVILKDEEGEETSSFLWWSKKDDTSSNMQLPPEYKDWAKEDKPKRDGTGGKEAMGAASTVVSGLFSWLGDRNNAAAVKAQAESAAIQSQSQLELEKIRKETAEALADSKDSEGVSTPIIIASIAGAIVLVGLVVTVIVVTRDK